MILSNRAFLLILAAIVGAVLPASESGPITDKTLVVWVSPSTLDQHGGGVLTIEKPGDIFDAVVFAEHQPARWMAGSEGGKRSVSDQHAWPAETAPAGTPVQIAIVYKGRGVAIFRNGKPYANYVTNVDPETFDPATATILMGLRHQRASRPNQGTIGRADCFFAGAIDDARIYDRALDPTFLASLHPKQPSNPMPWAWWPFIHGSTADVMGTFPPGVLIDGARITEDRLVLDTFSSRMLVDRMPAPGGPELYHEALRPMAHFTARQWTRIKANPDLGEEGWMNDVNGLLFLHGEYHLFAQRWWRCWIHAISPDMVHWQELPPAFWMDNRFGGDQSGSAVIDRNNTSGLATNPKVPVMVAFWASTDERSQCISYSNDYGRTWSKYGGNPVLLHANRDPKVFWYEPGKHWVMVLSHDHDGYLFFTSPDLLHWSGGNAVPGFYECPDCFQLPIDGDAQKTAWVVDNGDASFVVGSFDGTRFTPTGPRTAAIGPDIYAAQTWNTMPSGDHRRVQIGWLRAPGGYPGMPFSQQMTFPCELTLVTRAGIPRLAYNPIAEIATLHTWQDQQPDAAINQGEQVALATRNGPCHLTAMLELGPDAQAELRIRGESISIGGDHIAMRNFRAALSAGTTVMPLDILLDRVSIEVYANHGEGVIAANIKPGDYQLSVHAVKGRVALRGVTIHGLSSLWTPLRH